MIRVVHVLDPLACGDEGLLCCAVACQRLPIRQDVWVIGTSEDERRVREYGLEASYRIPRCAGPEALMRRRMLGMIKEHVDALGLDARSLLAQTWDLKTATHMVSMWASRRIACSTTLTRTPVDVGMLANLDRLGDYPIGQTISVIDPETVELLQAFRSRSAGSGMLCRRTRLLPPPCGLHGHGHGQDMREAVRRRLGIGRDQAVVGLLSDPPLAGCASQFCAAIGLDHVLGSNIVGLVRSGTTDVRRAARFTRSNADRWGFLALDVPLIDLIVASDVCVADTREHAGRRIATCGMTAIIAALEHGVPVVGVPELQRGWHAHGVNAPPMFIGAANRGAGRVAPPIHAALTDADRRVAHAREARAWLQQMKCRETFHAALAGIWSELLQLPLEGSSYALAECGAALGVGT